MVSSYFFSFVFIMIQENFSSVGISIFLWFPANSTNSTDGREERLEENMGSIWPSSCESWTTRRFGTPAQEWLQRARNNLALVLWVSVGPHQELTEQAWGSWGKGLMSLASFSASLPTAVFRHQMHGPAQLPRPQLSPRATAVLSAVIIPCLPSSPGLATAPRCGCLRVIALFLVDFSRLARTTPTTL